MLRPPKRLFVDVGAKGERSTKSSGAFGRRMWKKDVLWQVLQLQRRLEVY